MPDSLFQWLVTPPGRRGAAGHAAPIPAAKPLEAEHAGLLLVENLLQAGKSRTCRQRNEACSDFLGFGFLEFGCLRHSEADIAGAV